MRDAVSAADAVRENVDDNETVAPAVRERESNAVALVLRDAERLTETLAVLLVVALPETPPDGMRVAVSERDCDALAETLGDIGPVSLDGVTLTL